MPCWPRYWPERRASCSNRSSVRTWSRRSRTVGRGGSLLDDRSTAALLARLRATVNVTTSIRSPNSRTRSAEVFHLIGEGLTNRQIAQRMFLAEKTIKNYVSRILSKLDMQRRNPGRGDGDQAA